ncbi:MAG: response regulator transcription factor [Chlorobiaceae bacterium]|nr:response regulator transcription factor [Chlorobiaceae bacterium]
MHGGRFPLRNAGACACRERFNQISGYRPYSGGCPDGMGEVSQTRKYRTWGKDMTQQQQPRTAVDISVSIVDVDQEYRDAIVDYLNLRGYRASGFGSSGDFYQYILSELCDLVILNSSLGDQSGLVLSEYVRKNTGACIIMLCPASDVETRLAGYASGADACLVKSVDTRELMALVDNLADRMERFRSKTEATPATGETGAGDSAEPWKLYRNDWSLRTPKGDVVSLTAKEYEFMLTLVLQSTAIVTRQYILKILAYQPDDKGNRALESLIYRLRKKTEETGCGFPIKTYRGIGYCLSSSVVLS